MTAAPVPPVRPSRAVYLLETAAFALILAVLSVRPFVNEMPFRATKAMAQPPSSEAAAQAPDELVRLTFAMLLLLAAAAWAVGAALRREVRLNGGACAPRQWPFGLLAAFFVAWSAGSCLQAVDRRAAVNVWLEQTALVVSCLVMMRLCRWRRRRFLVLAVLAALAGVMALKALVQVGYEVPERVAQFEAQPVKQLAAAGIPPGTPQARMFEKRVRDPSAYGWLFLSNLFASLMIVLALSAAGLAAQKWGWARRLRKEGPSLPRGEVHLPTLAAVPTCVIALLAVAALPLTRSKGGILAGLSALTVAGLLCWRRGFFARHWRKALAWAGASLAAGAVAFVAYGLARGSVPTRSMQVRWEYWTGTVGILRHSPLFGAGGGNFGTAYLPHRLPEAAESTKLAHNALLDAAAQFGLPAAAVYLLLLGCLAWAMARPQDADALEDASSRSGRGWRWAGWVVLLPLAVMATRACWLRTGNAGVWFIDIVLPAAVFALLLLAGLWVGNSGSPAPALGPAGRIFLGCGLGGMLLHNLVESTLWAPATATVFWVAAGAAAARGGAGRQELGSTGGTPVARDVEHTGETPVLPAGRTPATLRRLALAVLPTAAVVVAGILFYHPVLARTLATEAGQSALAAGDIRQAVDEFRRAAQADPLDAGAAADVARLYLASALSGAPLQRGDAVAKSLEFAHTAYERSPSAENAALLSSASWFRDEPSAWLFFWRGRSGNLPSLRAKLASTVAENGPDPMLLNALAEVDFLLGRLELAYQELTVAAELFGRQFPKLHDRVGDLAWRLGRKDQAAKAWQAYRTASTAALAKSPAVEFAAKAVELDPMELSLRIAHAQVLYAAGDCLAARRQLDEARRIDAARPPDSDIRLTPAELEQIKLLEDKIALALAN